MTVNEKNRTAKREEKKKRQEEGGEKKSALHGKEEIPLGGGDWAGSDSNKGGREWRGRRGEIIS